MKSKEDNPSGNHHPYCIETYWKAKKQHYGWSCSCNLLNSYDKYLKETNYLKMQMGVKETILGE